MELINTHCHSKYCGHGVGDIEEYAKNASELGIATLAFTEHFPLSSTFDDGYISVPEDRLDDYRKAVKEAQDRHPEMEILLGLELDYLGQDEDRDLSEYNFDGYDLILGSVHFIDRWPCDVPSDMEKWERETDGIWNRYVEVWCEAASDKSQPFSIMSHPDLVKKFNYYPSFELGPLYTKMAKAAKAGDKMVEINTSGNYYACKEMYPAPPLLKAFCDEGVRCTVGTDAHDPKNVGRDIGKAYELLKAAGYTEVSVPARNNSIRTIPLE